MKRLVLEDKEEMIIALQNEINRTPDSRYDHRLHGVLMVANGMSCYEVAEMLGHGPRTIEYWVRSFNAHGFGRLYEKQRPGRPSGVPLDSLDGDLREDPHVFGYVENMWDGVLLRKHLSDHYGIDLGIRQCENIFHKLGFRLRRPRPMIAKGDPERKKDFKKTP
jgi:transposase